MIDLIYLSYLSIHPSIYLSIYCDSWISVNIDVKVLNTAHAYFKYDMDDPHPKRRTLVYFKEPTSRLHSTEVHR